MPPTSSLAQDFADIEQAADRAAALTRQLLAFSRRQSLNPVVLEINTVVSGLEGLLRRTLGDDLELRMVLATMRGAFAPTPASSSRS